MDKRILVSYASRHGATAEIAEKIGRVLGEAGLTCDLLPVDQVKDLSGYGAVVLGSAVYLGSWRKEAARFLEANEKVLSEQPIWMFSSGPTGEEDLVEILKGWHFPEALQPIADRIQPRDITVFHGALDMRKMNMIEKFMIKNIKAPVGDFRDWDTITTWVAAIAEQLQKANSSSGTH